MYHIEVATTKDINGTEITIGDKVYYSGASLSANFAVGYITKIVEYREDRGEIISTIVYMGKCRYRESHQVFKKLI